MKEKVKEPTPPVSPVLEASPEASIMSMNEFQKENPFNLAYQTMTKPYSTSFNFKK